MKGGAIFSKNNFFGTTHGDAWTPRLRSPSLIMAPVAIYFTQNMTSAFLPFEKAVKYTMGLSMHFCPIKLQLGFRFRFKFFDSFEGDCFDCDKNSTTTSIRPVSPKYCKARMQFFRVADILVQSCLIDAYNVRVFGVHQVLEAIYGGYTRIASQLLCCLCDNFLSFWHSSRGN